MEDEKMLPLGEPTLRFNPPSMAPTNIPPVVKPVPSYVPPNLPGVPSPKQQQWGVVISIVIIVLMIIIGAFYAWGQRIAENQIPAATAQ
ncbi:MAG: hypothetical protein NUV90_03815 [Candidatus Parcubacteria bacterium]|nr:hypothetical protein [Candidatus Parcubacteria bacterium]